MNIKFITDIDCVVNDYIGGFSPKEREIIKNNVITPILHLFSGNSNIGYGIDLNPNSKADLIMDIFEFIKQPIKKKYNTILLDPVYCNTERMELWREKYSKNIPKNKIYIYPYDSRKTKRLFDWFREYNPKIIILKSMDLHKIPGFRIEKAFIIEVGAFKPNRTLTIYHRNNSTIKINLNVFL